MYEPKTGIAMAQRVIEALKCGYHVVIGDSPGRAGRPAFLHTIQQYFMSIASSSSIPCLPIPQFIDVVGYKVIGERHELICGKDSSTISHNDNNQTRLETIRVAIMDLDPSIYKNKMIL
jgi:hypothetical protein